ncbi:MAG: cobyrinic acid a, partial [Trebouxia sp. A1-2]
MKVIVVSGVTSGVGKTSLTVGLMAAARRRGFKVQAFKVGPDFLDPLHHEVATGRPSVNLDGWMLNKQQNLESFHRHAADADICIVEGVMGLFDGRDGMTEAGSTAELAKWLGAPVLLVMDCWSVARSAAAMVKGYQEFDPDLNLAGVIFNKIGSKAHTQWLTEAVQATGVKTKVFGGIPKDDSIVIKERYLGLHMPHEMSALQAHLAKLADLVEAHLDMEQVFQTAATAQVPPLPGRKKATGHVQNGRQHVRIGVAKDDAFAFYYNDNLRLLEEAGADLIFFSPIEDCLPVNLAGLYLGGGYPEKYAQELSKNRMLLVAVKAFAEAGGVVYAECGGLIYLSQSIQPIQEPPASMAGLFPFRTQMTKDKMKMGYIEVETQQGCNLFPPHCKARGHVYHYSEILQEKVVGGFANGRHKELEWETGYQATMQVPGAEAVAEGYTWKNVLASYVHLHFGSAPQLAQSLVDSCRGVDLNTVNAAAARACHQEQHAAAAAEQQSIIHGGHMNSLHGMQNGSLHPQPHLPKMMSVPDFAVPFQSSSLYRPSNLVRHSADDTDIPCAHSQLQHQQQQQFVQQAHQQQLPRKVRYDPDGRCVAVDVFAQSYNPADYQSLSPQRTSSLPIFYKPLKHHSLPTSPLNDVAEHSSMEAPPHPQGSYPPSQWSQQPQHQHSQLVYPQQQLHQQLYQQPLQQLGQQPQQLHSPFQSPGQGSSLHGSQSPTYPPPLDATHSAAPPMNAILHPN